MQRIIRLIIFIIIIPTCIHAQDGWTELGPDLINPVGSSYSNFCADLQGNVYVGVGRAVYKKDAITNRWSQVGNGFISTDTVIMRKINSVTVDNAGNLYATGGFRNSANMCYVAKWNGSTWQEVGTFNISNFTITQEILCIKTDAAGNLYAAGQFTNNSGKSFLAKWDGNTWSEVGTGVNALDATGDIKAIGIDKTGNIYLSGAFTNTSGNYYLAKWNGLTWSQIAGDKGPSSTICSDKTGNVYIGGYINTSGNYYVAKWDGATWSEVGQLNANNVITSINTDTSGNLYAAGVFTNTSGKLYVAKWNGSTWSEIGNLNGYTNPYSLSPNTNLVFSAPNNDLYIAGYATDTWGLGEQTVAKWNGTGWILEYDSTTYALNAQAGAFVDIVADNNGSIYTTMGGNTGTYIVKWNGATWTKVGTGANALSINGIIDDLVVDKTGNIYVTWHISSTYHLVEWNGNTWAEINIATLNGDARNYKYINTIAVDTLGNLYVAGTLTNASGKYCVIKWNGNTWSEVGNLNARGSINKIKFDKAGNLYAVDFYNADSIKCAAKWDGTTWTQLGTGTAYPVRNSALCIETDNSGNLYVAEGYGYATFFPDGNPIGGYVYKWDGTTWTKVGSNSNYLYSKWGIEALAIDSANNVYASAYTRKINTPGSISTTSSITNIYKWDGSSWKPAGNEELGINAIGEIYSILYNKGTLYAGGSILNGKGTRSITKYTPIINSTTYIYTGSGTWENTANWSGGKVPDMNSDVIIANGANVTINTSPIIRSIKVSPTAIVTVSSGNTLTVLH